MEPPIFSKLEILYAAKEFDIKTVLSPVLTGHLALKMYNITTVIKQTGMFRDRISI